jgi:predicted nucleic acid-binding protein
LAVHFFDSSALVKRYVSETGSMWVLSLVDPFSGHQSYMARITGAEIAAAVAARARAGTLSPVDAVTVLTTFRHDFRHEYRIIEITPALIEAAMSLAEAHAIRGYDAVQLAAALELHAECLAAGTPLTLISSDGMLNTAAAAEGVTVADPNSHP